MSSIEKIFAREIIDSRGSPTVEVEVYLEKICAKASVPSGASTGSFEAHELRDNEKNRFFSKGVSKAVNLINTEINETIQGMDVSKQKKIDQTLIKLDGTSNKSRLGSNSILAVSLACAKAASKSLNIPLFNYMGGISLSLPTPLMNIVNGGCHANNKLDFQEFMIQPVGFSSFKECLICGVEVFNCLKKTLNQKGFSTAVGDEGGFAPGIDSAEEALDFISSSIRDAGYQVNKDVTFALDCAATELMKKNEYIFSNKSKLSSDQLIDYLAKLTDDYPLTSIEDGLDENDWVGWESLTKKLGNKTQLVGDDLFVTNKEILQKGIKNGVANSVLVKINQIGTISETFETIDLAYRHNYKCVISHRSGETEDSFIADLAVGTGAGQIKTGAPSRSDRTSKYNRLLMIDDMEQLNFLGRQELANC